MSTILTKLETRSHRVKGVAFHAKRPWVIIGLHNGAVQIMDYRTNTTIDRFEEHEGPVRGVDFHVTQPLFVTGGDDYKIKVWNFKFRRCLYSLTGHLDYIRTVQFHKEQPWIVSASDDQTLRIWNWQSRSCVSVLAGHNHYVMSASFHPRDDLVVSASLDLTVRVWDVSGLKAKRQDGNALAQDLFGSNDAVVKFILEGHEKGVNWASFHPTKQHIVSAADDRSIRIWRMDETRCCEIEQLRGHNNNVSCVVYFKDLIVSNSEDKTIRVWETSQRTPIQTYRKENERFWVLAVHPEQNLLAAGHDTGMMVFKLERERPAFCISGKNLLYIRDRFLKAYSFDTNRETASMQLRRHNGHPVTMSCNPADTTVVLWYEIEGGFFELFTALKGTSLAEGDAKKGYYTDAVFFGANKFAVLDKSRQIVIRTTSNEIAKVLPAVEQTDRLFPGPQGMITCRSDDKICLFDVAQKVVVGEIAVSHVKRVVWDAQFNRVALMSKNTIVVATRRLKHVVTINEPVRIKSAAFDEDRLVLFYATANHLKYCALHNGETGTIRTLENPVYLVRSKGDQLWFITRDGNVVMMTVDNSELMFKLALQQERYRDVLRLIQDRKVHGQCLVSYLHKSGHPDIAMHFVADKVVKFNLALECGQMAEAKQLALEINNPDCWRRLAQTATRFGDLSLALLANAKTQNWSALCMQCITAGNIPALQGVMAKARDPNVVMHFGMFSPESALQRIQILESSGQLPLAYSLARSNGLEEKAEQLLAAMTPEVAARAARLPIKQAIYPKEVVPQDANWPTTEIKESLFTRLLRDPSAADQPSLEATAPAWADDDLEFDQPADGAVEDGTDAVATHQAPQKGGDWDDDDLELDSMLPAAAADSTAAPAASGGFVAPREGEPLSKHWVDTTNVAAYHVAAGQFLSALQLLQRQIGLVDGEPLLPYAMNVWTCANATLPFGASVPSHLFPVPEHPAAGNMKSKHIPMIPKTLPTLIERSKQGYQAVTDGRFADALRIFQSIMHQLVFTVCDSQDEIAAARELLSVSREYVAALNVEVLRKEVAADPSGAARAVELAAYFTHFKLQTTHLVLGLGQAMSQAFKLKNMKLAAALAARIIDLDPPADRAEKARKVIQVAGAVPTDAVKIEYEERNPFVLCCVSKKPMYRGVVDPIRCTYCSSAAHPSNRRGKCTVCQLGILGGEAAGLVWAAQ